MENSASDHHQWSDGLDHRKLPTVLGVAIMVSPGHRHVLGWCLEGAVCVTEVRYVRRRARSRAPSMCPPRPGSAGSGRAMCGARGTGKMGTSPLTAGARGISWQLLPCTSAPRCSAGSSRCCCACRRSSGFLAAGFALGAGGAPTLPYLEPIAEPRGRAAAVRHRSEARRPHAPAPRDLADHRRAHGAQRRDGARLPRPARGDRVRVTRRRVVRCARPGRVRPVVLLDGVRRQGPGRPLRHHLALRAHRRRCARHAGRRRGGVPVDVQRRAAQPVGAAARSC